jgi:G3E family GTPase
MDTLPVTLLMGFLGAGKTSLLKRALADPRFADTAVVINEFGDVGLDHLLVDVVPEVTVEVTEGCLCCTVRGDIRRALLLLLERSERGEIPLFSRLVIETTGLADPAPVIHTLMVDPGLQRRFHLSQVVTLVDAVNGLETLENHVEGCKQVAVADQLVLSKTDLVAPSADLLAMLARLNPSAERLISADPTFDLRVLLGGVDRFDPAARGTDVLAWLGAEATAHHHHHHHHLDVNRHSDRIQAYTVILDQPISRWAFSIAMELLAANQGANLLRVKGLVALAEHPDQPVVIHAVQHAFHEPLRLERWPSDDHRSRIVFIVRDIPKDTMDHFLSAWTVVQPMPDAMTAAR